MRQSGVMGMFDKKSDIQSDEFTAHIDVTDISGSVGEITEEEKEKTNMTTLSSEGDDFLTQNHMSGSNGWDGESQQTEQMVTVNGVNDIFFQPSEYRQEKTKDGNVEDYTGKGVSDETGEESSSKIEELTEHINEMGKISFAMSANVDRLLEKTDSLQQNMKSFALYEKTVETLRKSLAANQRNEENMAKELADYKKDIYFSHVQPFLQFMINMHIELKKSYKQYLNDKEEIIQKYGKELFDEITELLQYLINPLESQLGIQGVAIISYEPGMDFISGEQSISKPVMTDDAEQVGKLAYVESDCYKYQNKVLRAAKVHVYRFGSKG